MRPYLSEAIATYTLVFAGTGAIVVDTMTNGAVSHVGVAATFGLVVTALIYALADVSGPHMNPAMTIGLALNRQFPATKVVPYILSQCVGAIAASGTLLMLFGKHGHLGATLPSGSDLQSFVLEVLLTSFLMFTVLCVSNQGREGRVGGALAIGAVVGLEAMFAGPVSGASMNPARSLAPALVSGELSHLWLYLAAPILGAALAVPTWRITVGRKSI